MNEPTPFTSYFVWGCSSLNPQTSFATQNRKDMGQFHNGKLLPSLNYTLKSVPSFHLLVSQVSAANAPQPNPPMFFLGKRKEIKNEVRFDSTKGKKVVTKLLKILRRLKLTFSLDEMRH
jgi:hypothetical protein